ncbi:hypothetical protein H072_3404 [Dactylellina haptotyla CBS 200.50]|uniref:Uncharacterized protein n=1 Tax=Dactylellina haptotyla (strain CBS 200.50) TaxID=1284197 RepID=S8BSZ8_DACHA|nr:hypothetical protein H072_3404 [Dactylellina haptotyla CBS 200.50]
MPLGRVIDDIISTFQSPPPLASNPNTSQGAQSRKVTRLSRRARAAQMSRPDLERKMDTSAEKQVSFLGGQFGSVAAGTKETHGFVKDGASSGDINLKSGANIVEHTVNAIDSFEKGMHQYVRHKQYADEFNRRGYKRTPLKSTPPSQDYVGDFRKAYNKETVANKLVPIDMTMDYSSPAGPDTFVVGNDSSAFQYTRRR